MAVLVALTGCYEAPTITGCAGSTTWFGRPPLTLCMKAINPRPAGVLLYAWDFGDGATGSGQEVTHTYTAVGQYKVVVDLTFDDGKRDTVSKDIVVAGVPLAAFTHEIYEPTGISGLYHSLIGTETNELHIRFDASSSYPAEDAYMYRSAQVHWSFGDGTERINLLPLTASSQWWSNSKMAAAHIYPAAGVYAVTVTLTDNLGYSDTTTQTITVDTPGDDDDEDLAEEFELGAIFWELDDEDEEDCITIDGTVQNDGAVAAGVELTATTYNAIGTAVGTFTYWPAGSTNIASGADYIFVSSCASYRFPENG
ncbi:PKD domain-containing protein [Candidatus Bipolaricaulota bacterium]